MARCYRLTSFHENHPPNHYLPQPMEKDPTEGRVIPTEVHARCLDLTDKETEANELVGLGICFSALPRTPFPRNLGLSGTAGMGGVTAFTYGVLVCSARISQPLCTLDLIIESLPAWLNHSTSSQCSAGRLPGVHSYCTWTFPWTHRVFIIRAHPLSASGTHEVKPPPSLSVPTAL